MSKSKKKVASSDVLFHDDDEWDEHVSVDDVSVSRSDRSDNKWNAQARRLCDRFQEERRLRQLLQDDFAF